MDPASACMYVCVYMHIYPVLKYPKLEVSIHLLILPHFIYKMVNKKQFEFHVKEQSKSSSERIKFPRLSAPTITGKMVLPVGKLFDGHPNYFCKASAIIFVT